MGPEDAASDDLIPERSGAAEIETNFGNSEDSRGVRRARRAKSTGISRRSEDIVEITRYYLLQRSFWNLPEGNPDFITGSAQRFTIRRPKCQQQNTADEIANGPRRGPIPFGGHFIFDRVSTELDKDSKVSRDAKLGSHS